jgi:acetylornithine/succinyldiaminopimelate/putrescine aminotransferase
VLARVRAGGERLRARLEELPGVIEVRGRGLMNAFDLSPSHPPAPELARRALLEQRLVVNATGPQTIRLLPPLFVTDAELDEAVDRLGTLLSA